MQVKTIKNIFGHFRHTATPSTADFAKKKLPFHSMYASQKYSNNPNLKLQSTPSVQVQNTKFDGIILLIPAVQQNKKDLYSAIKDNISSITKKKHGSINHLRMRELMEPDKGVDKLEENHVNKLKASILLDVKGIWKEVVSSFNSASYGILEDVLDEHFLKLYRRTKL